MSKQKKETRSEISFSVSNVALLLINYRDRDTVINILKSRGIDSESIPGLMREAEEAIVLASSVNRKKELGIALARLDAQYEAVSDFAQAATPRDIVSLVTAAREITERRAELLDLKNNVNVDELHEDVQSQTEEYIREHLEGLGLTQAGLPLEELARQTALAVINLTGFKKRDESKKTGIRKTQEDHGDQVAGAESRRPGHRSDPTDKKSGASRKLRKKS